MHFAQKRRFKQRVGCFKQLFSFQTIKNGHFGCLKQLSLKIANIEQVKKCSKIREITKKNLEERLFCRA